MAQRDAHPRGDRASIGGIDGEPLLLLPSGSAEVARLVVVTVVVTPLPRHHHAWSQSLSGSKPLKRPRLWWW
jgi:hypothetical protein